jgi:dTDP-4-dehydrorhamnose reductase
MELLRRCLLANRWQVTLPRMKPRLLIIGASGFVGSRSAPAAQANFDVVCAARRPPAGAANWLAIDITDAASVRAAFDAAQPDHVTLLAALSDIDRCQRETELAERINVAGARHVAEACASFGSRLLYTSTDAVFDGTRGHYRESDPPSPPNFYGETKARAERLIAELLPTATIVRLSLVLGTSAAGGGNSYLEKVVGNLRAGNEIISPTYEFRNPLDVGTLCEFLGELTISADATGIFHAGAVDKISRFDLALAIARHLGADEKLIVPQSAPVPGRAPRGADDFLATDRLQAICRTPVPTCAEVLERALALV